MGVLFLGWSDTVSAGYFIGYSGELTLMWSDELRCGDFNECKRFGLWLKYDE